GVDRRVGLDGVGQVLALAEIDVAVQRADDAGSHRSLKAERTADRDGQVADTEVACGAERSWRQPRLVDLDHGDVVPGRCRSHEGRGQLLPVAEGHPDRARVLDDVIIRDDVAVAPVDDAGSGARRALTEGTGRARDVDAHDARHDALRDGRDTGQKVLLHRRTRRRYTLHRDTAFPRNDVGTYDPA